jgi:hypothetical protein
MMVVEEKPSPFMIRLCHVFGYTFIGLLLPGINETYLEGKYIYFVCVLIAFMIIHAVYLQIVAEPKLLIEDIISRCFPENTAGKGK